MAIMRPLNDVECLSLLHKEASQLRKTKHARRIARRFDSVAHLIAYIRRCKQRNDLGEEWDGPRLPCRVSQRARFATSDPNCFERTLFFLTIAPLIDPSLELSSASMLVNEGWHTFPVRFRNQLPEVVVLDPLASPPRNAMSAAAYQVRNANPERRANIAHWFLDTARNACLEEGTEQRFDRAIDSLRNSLVTGESIEHLEDVAYVLSLTSEDAELWGKTGRAAFNRVHDSIRNLSFNLDVSRVGKFVDGLVKQAETLGPDALKAALLAKYGPAAAIALQGANLAFGDAPPTKPKRANTPTTNTVTTTKAVTTPGTLADHSKAKNEIKTLTPIQHARRMTFGFR